MRMIKKTFNLIAKYGWSMTLMLLGAFALGFTWSSSDQLYTNIRLFDRIAMMVSENYVADVDEGKMIKAGIDAMLSKLDKYSRFLQDADYMRLRQETDGQFEGSHRKRVRRDDSEKAGEKRKVVGGKVMKKLVLAAQSLLV